MSTMTSTVAADPATDVLGEQHGWLEANWSPAHQEST